MFKFTWGVLVVLCTASAAQVLLQHDQVKISSKSPAMQQEQVCLKTGDERYTLDKILLSTFDSEMPGTVVGKTAYNYQCNYTLKDRIVYDPESQAVHVTWMFGDIAETPGFSGRRMYYNYFDGGSWVHSLGVPVENVRSGYGVIEKNEENAAILASHFADGVNVWYDFQPGFGFFSSSKVYYNTDYSPPVYNPTWPDFAIDAQGGWHYVATNFDDAEGFPQETAVPFGITRNVLYWRSVDQGNSWSASPFVFFDDTTYYEFHEPKSALNAKALEASDIDNGKLGGIVIDNWHDIYFFESSNYGETWERGQKIIGNSLFDSNDSLTFPMTWDVVIKDSVTVDTLLSSDFGINVDSRPVGDADLLYVNGEPHVVWNEYLVTIDEGNVWYPWGIYDSLRTNYTYLDGSNSRAKLSFFLKHWSPSTGISIVHQEFAENNVRQWWPGSGAEFIGMPSLGVDAGGTLYCVFSKSAKTDTVSAEDGSGIAPSDRGPLCFTRLWGAKSTDGGKTWFDAVQLIDESVSHHQDIRFPALANRNGDDDLHVLFQVQSTVPWTAIHPDHNVWVEAELRHISLSTDVFPTTKTPTGPQLSMETSSTLGGLDFGDIGSSAPVSQELVIKNIGDEDLMVDGIFAGSKAFQAEPASFTVMPGEAKSVTVTFSPLSEESYFTYLTIPTNDPARHSAGIPLEGQGIPVHVDQKPTYLPTRFQLSQNYPNPFNPMTTISYALPKHTHVRMAIYNILGKKVYTLVDEPQQAGRYQIQWRADDMPNGVYFYQLHTQEFNEMRKMILLQ